MVTIGDALRDTIINNYGIDGGGGTKPSEIVHIIDIRTTPPYRPTTEFIAVWLPIPCTRYPVNDNYVDVTCHLMVRVSTPASDDRLKVMVDEVRRVCNKCAVKYVDHQLVIRENEISDRRVPVYMMDMTVELTSNMVKSEIAYDGVTYDAHAHDHDTLTNVVTDQHHTKYTDAEVDVIVANHAALATVHQDAPGLIATHTAIDDAHHSKYTDGEVETVIIAELVDGQSIDNAIDSLISTHAGISTAHQDAPGLIATHTAIATAHQDAPGLIATHASDDDAHHAVFESSDFTTQFATESLANLNIRTHASLSDAPADAHHVAFVLSDFTTAFAAESLANLATRTHGSLSDAPTSAHHVRYADSEAVDAVEAADPLALAGDLQMAAGKEISVGLINNQAGAYRINFEAPRGFQLTTTSGDNLEANFGNPNSDVFINAYRAVINSYKTGVRIDYAGGSNYYHYLVDDGADSHNLHLWSRNALKISAGTSEVVGIELDSSAEIVKMGQDTPSTGQYLQWDGSKAVWTSIGAGGPGSGTPWDLPVWDATGSALTDSMVSQNAAGTAATIGGSVALSAGTSVNDIDIVMAASPTDNQLLTAQGIQEFIYKHNNIGSGNSDWINCPYEGAYSAAGDQMYYDGSMVAYHVEGSGRYVYSVPLPTTRGGKGLYINGTRVSLSAATGSNRVYETNLYGMGNTTATELDSDTTNKASVNLWEDTSMGNKPLSGYDAAKVILKTAVATAGSLKVQYVTVRYYYA